MTVTDGVTDGITGGATGVVPPRQFAVDPGAGRLPVTVHRRTGNAEDVGRLGNRVAREEAALDDLRNALVLLSENLEKIIDQNHLLGSGLAPEGDIGQVFAGAVPRALLCCLPAGDVDEHLTHGPSSYRVEVLPVLPLNGVVVNELLVGFVDQFRRLKRMVISLPVKLIMRDPSELVVDGRHQLVQRRRIPAAEAAEKAGHL